jgi:hypothetical protein
MKNTIKLLGIIVFAVVIGFSMAACGGDGRIKNDIQGDTILVEDWQVRSELQEITATNFGFQGLKSLSEYFIDDYVVEINDWILTLELGIPKPEQMKPLSSLTVEYGIELTITPSDVEYFRILPVFNSIDEEYRLRYRRSDTHLMEFVYVSANVTIEGGGESTEYPGTTFVYNNVRLFEGWNFLIIYHTVSTDTYTYSATRRYPERFHWIVDKPSP